MCGMETWLLEDYAEGLLDSAATALLEAHLATCPDCRRELTRIKLLFWELESQRREPIEVPEALAEMESRMLDEFLAGREGWMSRTGTKARSMLQGAADAFKRPAGAILAPIGAVQHTMDAMQHSMDAMQHSMNVLQAPLEVMEIATQSIPGVDATRTLAVRTGRAAGKAIRTAVKTSADASMDRMKKRIADRLLGGLQPAPKNTTGKGGGR